MSSIERAMEKLRGASGAKPPAPDSAPVESTRSGPADEPPPANTPAVDTSAAAPAAETPASSSEADAATPSLAPAEAPATVAAEHTLPMPTPEVTVPSHAPAARLAGDVAVIDFERLAAAGFLVPGQTMTREAEEFQRIKRRLLGNMVPGVYASERPANLVLITSSVPSEGKTFVSVNLAISIAMEIDRTVLAIDTDIVKRDMSKVFGVVNRRGLFDLLADPELELQDLLVRTSVPNLSILPAGNRHTSSTEMLASQRMQELTDEIAARYGDRVILFDSPPVLAMTTATALAPLMGQVIIVCEAGNTKHETVKETLLRLDNVRVTGVILNKSKQAYAPGYDYYGSYGNKG